MSIPANWQPKYSEGDTRRLLERYKGRADRLSEDRLKELENHAQAYNLPFYTGDFSLLSAVNQAASGFVEGFTTFGWADHPDNEYEAISKNLGHLAGFAPSLMAGPFRAAGNIGLLKGASASNIANKLSAVRSIPMKGADIITKYTKKKIEAAGIGAVGRSEAIKTVNNFYLGEKAAHVIEGAFHLGTASAISAWRGSIDEKMDRLVENKRSILNEVVDGTAQRDKGESIINELLSELSK